MILLHAVDIVSTFAGRDGNVAFGKDPYSGDWTDTAQLNYWCLGGQQCLRALASVI